MPGTNKVPTSVITSHIRIPLDPNNLMQTDQFFKPSNSMLQSLDTEIRERLTQTMTLGHHKTLLSNHVLIFCTNNIHLNLKCKKLR